MPRRGRLSQPRLSGPPALPSAPADIGARQGAKQSVGKVSKITQELCQGQAAMLGSPSSRVLVRPAPEGARAVDRVRQSRRPPTSRPRPAGQPRRRAAPLGGPTRLLSAGEVGELLGIPERTVRACWHAWDLPADKIGKHLRWKNATSTPGSTARTRHRALKPPGDVSDGKAFIMLNRCLSRLSRSVRADQSRSWPFRPGAGARNQLRQASGSRLLELPVRDVRSCHACGYARAFQSHARSAHAASAR